MEANITIDLKGTGWDHMNCIHVTQDREQWLAVMNMVLIPLSSINCEFLDWLRNC